MDEPTRELVNAVHRRFDDFQDAQNRRLDDLGRTVRDHAEWTTQAHHELTEMGAALGRGVQDTREAILSHIAQPGHHAAMVRIDAHEQEINALRAGVSALQLDAADRAARDRERVRLMRVVTGLLSGIFALVAAILLAVIGSLQVDLFQLARWLTHGG